MHTSNKDKRDTLILKIKWNFESFREYGFFQCDVPIVC